MRINFQDLLSLFEFVKTNTNYYGARCLSPAPLVKRIQENKSTFSDEEKGPNLTINQRDEYKKTPLMYAVQNGHDLVAKFLIEMKADVDLQDTSGNTVLMSFLYSGVGNTTVALALIQAGSSLDVQNSQGETALILSLSNYFLEVAAKLIEAKANVNVATKTGKNALIVASECGNFEIVKRLLAVKANIDAQDLDFTDPNNPKPNHTVLMRAIFRGAFRVAAHLLEAKANLEIRDAKNQSALDMALKQWKPFCSLLDSHERSFDMRNFYTDLLRPVALQQTAKKTVVIQDIQKRLNQLRKLEIYQQRKFLRDDHCRLEVLFDILQTPENANGWRDVWKIVVDYAVDLQWPYHISLGYNSNFWDEEVEYQQIITNIENHVHRELPLLKKEILGVLNKYYFYFGWMAIIGGRHHNTRMGVIIAAIENTVSLEAICNILDNQISVFKQDEKKFVEAKHLSETTYCLFKRKSDKQRYGTIEELVNKPTADLDKSACYKAFQDARALVPACLRD